MSTPSTKTSTAHAPAKSVREIVYIVDCRASHFRASDKKWFQECLESLESLEPLPSNLKATSDPRDQSSIEQWRDAVRRELGLAFKWRRQGLVLRLTGLRLESGEDQQLWCYDPKSAMYNSTHDHVCQFVEDHPTCHLRYYIDFFTEDDIEAEDADDFETSALPDDASSF